MLYPLSYGRARIRRSLSSRHAAAYGVDADFVTCTDTSIRV